MKIYLYEQPATMRASLTKLEGQEYVGQEFDVEWSGSERVLDFITPQPVIHAIDEDGDQIASFNPREVIDWADGRGSVWINFVSFARNASAS